MGDVWKMYAFAVMPRAFVSFNALRMPTFSIRRLSSSEKPPVPSVDRLVREAMTGAFVIPRGTDSSQSLHSG
jgi:hypothetical protein